MEVILLEKIRNLGDLGTKMTVKSGYARNYLIPQGKAVRATEKNSAEFAERRAQLEQRANEQLAAAKERASTLEELTVKLEVLVSEEGKLYGSIGLSEIQHAIMDAGHSVEKQEILLAEGPIRELGEHTVEIRVHSDIVVAIKLVVSKQE